ncbi:MAG: hypothetical protein ABIA21_01365 [Candidatus Aenigmatarchaeota archaeon]
MVIKRRGYVTICPKCESKEVDKVFFASGTGFDVYTCLSCGYRGNMFPEVTEEEARLLPNKHTKLSTSQSRSYIAPSPITNDDSLREMNTYRMRVNLAAGLIFLVLITLAVFLYSIIMLLVGILIFLPIFFILNTIFIPRKIREKRLR